MAWTTIDNTIHKAACDGIVALFNSGYVKLIESPSTELARPQFGATAFGAATAANPAVATANSFTADTSVTAGTITLCEFLASNGSTVLLAGSVGTSGADLVLSSVTIPSGATSVTFTDSSFTFSVAVS